MYTDFVPEKYIEIYIVEIIDLRVEYEVKSPLTTPLQITSAASIVCRMFETCRIVECIIIVIFRTKIAVSDDISYETYSKVRTKPHFTYDSDQNVKLSPGM